MTNKYKILIIFIFFMTANISFAGDFYPELGIDPFYSSLNPMYTNEDEFVQEEATVFNWIKNKFKNKSKKKDKEEEQIQSEYIEEKEAIEEEVSEIKPVNDIKKEESKYIAPKKPMTKKELEKALIQEEKEKQKAKEAALKEQNKTLSLKDRIFSFGKKKEVKEETQVEIDPTIELTADVMEYYPERYEIEAVGNAFVNFKLQKTTLSANKITFNYDRNILKAHQDVVLTAPDSTTEGDFIKLDLNRLEGWIDKPVTNTEDIKITAKEAFIYPEKIEEYDGIAKIMSDEVIRLGAASFAGYVDQSNVLQESKPQISDDEKGYYNLKAKTILIDAKKDHDIITVKNADLYFKNHKVGIIPSLKIVTNKDRANVETNLPEFGSESMLGSHIGPAVVLNVPGGSTLKLAPILTYSKSKVGIGGIARFRNEYNMTEVAYGTSRDELLVRGRHKIAPGLMLNYSRLTNQSEWFLGYRMPKYSAQLTYSRSDDVKDLKLRFSQLYSAGIFVDRRDNVDFGDAEGRFRWMTQTYKPIYKYVNEEGNIGFSTGLIAQTVATVYTTGDTLGLFRIGPSVSTKVGPWQQAFIYYQTASAGNSPFDFDRYRYGRSNVVLVESLKLCKYITVGYLASIAMNREVKSDDTFQENRILLSLGPDYAKVTIGYDSLRRSTMFLFSMLLGTEDSEIKFDKSVLKNPDRFGRDNSKVKKPKKKNYKKYLKEDV